MDRFISIARITKVRGIKGEVAAEILTDFPDRFSSLTEIRISTPGQVFHEQLEDFWFHKNRIILKFQDRDRPEEVQELVGGFLEIEEEQRVELPEDTFFDSDLVGCTVIDSGRTLGQVIELFKAGEEMTNLVVRDPDRQEFMLPMVKEFILAIDIDRKIIEVQPPPGLIEMNSSSTAAERNQRKGSQAGKQQS